MRSIEVSDVLVVGGEIIFKVSLILGLAAFIGSLVRKRFPTGAHLAWVLAFCAVIILPLATAFVPWRSVLYLNILPGQPIEMRHLARTGTNPGPVNSRSAGPRQSAYTPAEESQPAESEPPSFVVLILEAPWLVGLSLLWFAGFLAVAVRSAYGLHSLRMIRRYGTNPISSEQLIIEAERLSADLGQRRIFDLRICATAEMPIPMTWGVIRPTILLPRDAEGWTPKRFEATMLHELSHVRRYDYLSQLMAEFVCAIYWFNPFVWMSARTMRSDAELAADEAVLHAGLKPSDYAAELLMLAADLGNRPIPFATLGTPAMTNSKIETRLESILAPTAGRRGVTTIQLLAALSAAVFAIPAFAALHASAQTQTPEDAKSERTVALSNAKQMALATLMYCNDYDGDYPYVQQTASAAEVLQPYCRNKDIFESPTKGGRFLFNMNLAGVNSAAIELPADTAMWTESLPDPKMHVAVAFADGHAKLIDPAAMADPRTVEGGAKGGKPMTFLKAISYKHFERAKTMKPLPYNYLLPIKP